MTKIRYEKGDALAGPELYFAHGCNAQGVMGSGIALQVKTQFPEAYKIYRHTYKNDALQLGQVIGVTTKSKVIFNCITQENFGRDPDTVYVDYDAIRDCMEIIDKGREYFHKLTGIKEEIAMPMIGAGLGNGDWSVIEKIIEDASINFQPVIYTYDVPALG